MQKWMAQDRDGREIYLTEERWNHILERHPYLQDHLEDVLDTIRQGKRQQQPHDPQAFVYRKECNRLPRPFSGEIMEK